MMASLMMCSSVTLLLVGMIAGIMMGIQQNVLFGPAHAHLNLIGGVLLFLFGLYYRVVPKAAGMILAKVQASLHILGGVLFPLGVALVLGGGPRFEPVAVAGSLVVLVAMVLFMVIVLRTARPEEGGLPPA
jgi:peptidoglycan/LPS O-acetylase OafA/YrhL